MEGMPLSHFVQLLGNTLRKERGLQYAWVTAELSDVRMSGGHCYFELVEKTPSGSTLAKLRANIWAGTLGPLRHKFLAATGKDIASGMKVMVQGSVTHHNVYGLSFNVTDIDPTYTLGDMERIRKEILDALARANVIDFNKHVAFSPVPQRIAVISAAGAAGYGDFMDQLERNAYGFKFYTHLFPAVMQGERTAESVMAALDRIEETIDLWDCVVIIRGGGATTDLNGFDNLQLAYRVATCPLPVIVGIGHERDRTVLDEIAQVRAKTPTAVAEYLILRLQTAAERLVTLVQQVRNYAVERLHGEQQRLSSYQSLIPNMVEMRLRQASLALEKYRTLVPNVAGGKIAAERHRLEGYKNMTGLAADHALRREQALLQRLGEEMPRAARAAFSREEQRLYNLGKMVAILDPGATLRRGYSITRLHGHAVTDPSQVPPSSRLETTLAGGVLRSISDTEEPIVKQ